MQPNDICSSTEKDLSFDATLRRRKTPKLERTLALVLASLKGEAVVLELKNDAEVTGTIEESDHNMNITLHDATYIAVTGEARVLETVFINGSSILYVHLPPNVDMKSQIGSYLVKVKGISSRKNVVIPEDIKKVYSV